VLTKIASEIQKDGITIPPLPHLLVSNLMEADLPNQHTKLTPKKSNCKRLFKNTTKTQSMTGFFVHKKRFYLCFLEHLFDFIKKLIYALPSFLYPMRGDISR
jgi:hypothetical protein